MRVLKAHVKGGQLVVDDPVDLPEGSEVRLALVDDDEELDEAGRAELESALDESEGELEAGLGVGEEELWARLRALR